jgi:hypothetical protein
MTIQIEVNDRVQGRFYNENRTQVAVQNFTVTEIDGKIYKGGALDCDTDSGWEIRLIKKALMNLGLPSELSEITVYDLKDSPTLLTGKGSVWRNNKGALHNLDNVFRWESGHIEIQNTRVMPTKTVLDLDA